MSSNRPSLEEFDAKHAVGGDPLPIDGWLYFPTGARRSNHGHVSRIVFHEADTEVERLQSAILYWKQRVKNADRAFKAETERLRHEALDRHVRGIESNALHGEDAIRYGRKKSELEIAERMLRETVNQYQELPIVKQIAATRQRAKAFKAPV